MAAEALDDLAAPRTRLALLLLMAPALVWLVGLIVLQIPLWIAKKIFCWRLAGWAADHTFGVNWYPNNAVRFLFDYQLIEVSRLQSTTTS